MKLAPLFYYYIDFKTKKKMIRNTKNLPPYFIPADPKTNNGVALWFSPAELIKCFNQSAEKGFVDYKGDREPSVLSTFFRINEEFGIDWEFDYLFLNRPKSRKGIDFRLEERMKLCPYEILCENGEYVLGKGQNYYQLALFTEKVEWAHSFYDVMPDCVFEDNGGISHYDENGHGVFGLQEIIYWKDFFDEQECRKFWEAKLCE